MEINLLADNAAAAVDVIGGALPAVGALVGAAIAPAAADEAAGGVLVINDPEQGAAAAAPAIVEDV